MADLERRIFHIHPWEDKNSRFGKHKTQVERGTTVDVLGVWDNTSIEKSVSIPELGWKAKVTVLGMKKQDKFYTVDLRGWRNLPLHPGSLLGVGWSGFSGYDRDYVRAEKWLSWKMRQLRNPSRRA